MSALDKVTRVQRQELAQAIERIKTGDYRGTAIKVELEADLDRPDGERSYCDDCEGDGYSVCEYCDDGLTECLTCEGSEHVRENDQGELEACAVAWGDPVPEDAQDCPNCDEGFVTCSECGGDCRDDCDSCNGSGYNNEDPDGWDVDHCKDFLLEHVPAEARDALIYSRFYNDGSVDSEFTFTLPIDKAEYTVHFIEAFKQLSEEIGNGCNTDGAGMHIAILNNPSGSYPSGNRWQERQAGNFAKAMTPLLPALYFLASADYNSRGLGYRRPEVNLFEKYAAISGSHGCFEYRIFETCYERPLAILDYIIVIANTLEFYKTEATDTALKLGSLGIKDGRGIERFYYTEAHLKALDRGLARLKPAYKSIDTLKRERNFKVTPTVLKEREKKLEAEWAKDFERVKELRRWQRQQAYHEGLAAAYRQAASGTPVGDPREFARIYCAQHYGTLSGTVRQYIRQMKQQTAQEGSYFVVSTN